MILKEAKKLEDALTMKKRNLLSLLQPGDAFRFKRGRATEYFFVGRIMVRKEMIEGKYLDRSGELTKVSMSYDEIISKGACVAYFQEIIAAQ